jgi:hypothetical protein
MTSADVELLVRRLQDRSEIEALKHAFCRAADVLDIDAMTAGFTRDCVASYVVGEEIHGVEELTRWFHGEVDITVASSHMVTNFEVTFLSDSLASSRCLLNSWKRFTGYPDRPDRLRWATYTDEWTRTDEGWRQSGLVYRVGGELNGIGPERGSEVSPAWPPGPRP